MSSEVLITPAADAAHDTPHKGQYPALIFRSVAAVSVVEVATAGAAMPATPAMPAVLQSDVSRLIAAGIPENTRLAYAADRAAYAVFCQLHDVPQLPASGELLAAWAAQMLTAGNPAAPCPRPLAASTVERRLSAVSTLHSEQGLPRPDLRLARLVLRGHRREVGGDRPAKAAPVTKDMLTLLLEHARMPGAGSPPSVRSLRDSTVLMLGFVIAARRSELMSVDIDDITFTDQGMLVRVMRAKTRSRADAVAVPFAHDPRLCPVLVTGDYIRSLAQRGVQHGPLFRRITRTDRVLDARLRPEFVADLVSALAERAGLDVPPGFRGWSGHSLRRGLAVELRRAGADALAVARQGGWTDGSGALAGYLSDVDRWTGHPLDGVL